MRDDSETVSEAEPLIERRKRGRKPGSAVERRAAVEKALSELESANVPFTMADVAERAGISRATLYRDAQLRDLIGNRGEGPVERPVNYREYATVSQKAQDLGREQRRLKALLRHAERRADEATKRAALLEEENEKLLAAGGGKPLTSEDAERLRREAYADGFAAGTRAASQRGSARPGAGRNDLLAVAARLPRTSLVKARRTLVRALHPDLFTDDPAASLLATELLKEINALVGESGR
ncbi:MAG: hypothetical protein OHK0029_14180 [Armatimonadaceae bacterium]